MRLQTRFSFWRLLIFWRDHEGLALDLLLAPVSLSVLVGFGQYVSIYVFFLNSLFDSTDRASKVERWSWRDVVFLLQSLVVILLIVLHN